LQYHEHLLQQQSIVKAAQKELNELQTMYEESQVIRDWTKKEMHQREKHLHRYSSFSITYVMFK